MTDPADTRTVLIAAIREAIRDQDWGYLSDAPDDPGIGFGFGFGFDGTIYPGSFADALLERFDIRPKPSDPDLLAAVGEPMPDVLAVARNIVNQLGDLWSERIPSPEWVKVRQETNDRADEFVLRLIATLLLGEPMPDPVIDATTEDPGGRLFRSRAYKALAEQRDFTGHMDQGRRTAFYEGWKARETWERRSMPDPVIEWGYRTKRTGNHVWPRTEDEIRELVKYRGDVTTVCRSVVYGEWVEADEPSAPEVDLHEVFSEPVRIVFERPLPSHTAAAMYADPGEPETKA